MKKSIGKIIFLVFVLIWKSQLFAQSSFENIDQKTFIQLIKKAERIYSPIFKNKGRELHFILNWESPEMSASTTAVFEENLIINKITVNGGLPRFAGISQDGFTLIICHEIGHHIGGAPKYSMIGASWGTVEGQSDYFATLKCMKKMLKGENHSEFFKNKTTEPWPWAQCREIYSQDEQVAICVRSLLAGLEVAQIDQRLNPSSYVPYFWAPDTTVVVNTIENHLYPQCRLDTYIAGALCDQGDDENLNDYDENSGVCNSQFSKGNRPSCWYKESIADPYRYIRD